MKVLQHPPNPVQNKYFREHAPVSAGRGSGWSKVTESCRMKALQLDVGISQALRYVTSVTVLMSYKHISAHIHKLRLVYECSRKD